MEDFKWNILFLKMWIVSFLHQKEKRWGVIQQFLLKMQFYFLEVSWN